MQGPLRSEMFAVTGNPTLRTILVAAGCTTLGAAVGYASAPRTVSHVTVLRPTETKVVEKVIEKTVTREAPPRPARASEIQFVFTAGPAAYMKLAEISPEREIMPKHVRAKLYSADGIQSAVATVATENVPASYRAWLDRTIKVDGTCDAKVTGFAVVWRLTGSPGYVGDDTSDRWTANMVVENGTSILAAKLSACTGTLARDASLSPIVQPVVLPDDDVTAKLGAQAKAALLAADVSKDAQKEWTEAKQNGPWHKQATVDIKVVRHPVTNVTWVSVHIFDDFGCGGPSANVWGLYRVADDGSLVATQQRTLEGGAAVEELVDLEGDGELEILGRPWLGVERTITRANGEELDALSLPFFGCPC